MKQYILVAGAVGVLAVGVAAGVWTTSSTVPDPAPEAGKAIVQVTPTQLDGLALVGEAAFKARCAACHGENAAGRESYGPPLIHKIYEPSHHGDTAFVMAAQNGVRAHHWPFGDMPPVEGVTVGDVKAIVTYIRTLQRANGIF